jgi:hypothetical protein
MMELNGSQITALVSAVGSVVGMLFFWREKREKRISESSNLSNKQWMEIAKERQEMADYYRQQLEQCLEEKQQK